MRTKSEAATRGWMQCTRKWCWVEISNICKTCGQQCLYPACSLWMLSPSKFLNDFTVVECLNYCCSLQVVLFCCRCRVHHTYRPYDPLPSLLQRVVSSHNHTRTPCFIPVAPPFPFSCSTYTPATHSQYLHRNTVLSLPRPPSPLPHQPPIPYTNRTGIPIPVINN